MPTRRKVPKPPVDRPRALSLLFRGYPARRVGTELKCSNVTVSGILKKFISEAEEVGVLAAASNYGISEQVGKLIEISAAVESTKVDASRAPLGLRIVKAVESFGVDAEEAPAFIDACYAEAMRQGVSPESFVKTIKGLQGWRIGDKSDYQYLLDVVEKENKEWSELDAKVSDYREKAEAAKVEMNDAVRSKNTTIVELNQFTALKDNLAPHGLDLRDVEKTRNCIQNVAQQGNDSRALVAFYSQGVDLSKKVKDNEARLGTIAREGLTVGNKLRMAQAELDSKAELVERVHEAESLRLRPSQLGALVEKTREIGARHGLDNSESIKLLERDLGENWEPKLGFENERRSLEAKLVALEEKIKLAEGRERTAVENAKAQEEALKGFTELRRHVSPSEIIEFKRMIVDSGQQVSTFRVEVQRLGSVTAVIESEKQRRDAEVAKLRNQETTLNTQVLQLRKEKQMLVADIETLRSSAMAALENAYQKIRVVSDEIKYDFENPESGYEATIKRIGEESRGEIREEFKSQREAIRQGLDAAAKQIKGFVSDAETLRKETWDTAKLLGYNVHLIRLASLIGGEQVPQVEAVITMKATVDAFRSYLTMNKLESRCPSATTLSRELRGMLP